MTHAGLFGSDRDTCTLREFLLRGLWPIEVPGEPPPVADSLVGLRPPTDQALRIFALTGRHLLVTRDPANESLCGDLLDKHLKLDEETPVDLLNQYDTATVGARYFAPLTEANLHGALSQVYALVNRIIVDPTLRKDPRNAHLWATWNVEGDTTYLARGLEGSMSATSGTADGVCIANSGPDLHAIAILETKISALFLNFQRMTFHDIVSQQGFHVYLSWAGNKLRAWNCPLVDGCTSFWVSVLAQSWESMHIYKCDRMIVTSWQRSSVLARKGPNHLVNSRLLSWGPAPAEWDKSLTYLNLFQIILASALCDLDEPLERWEDHVGMPDIIPRGPPLPMESPASLPPTIPTTITGYHGIPTGHLFQTMPEDDETIVSFLECPENGHAIDFGALLSHGLIYHSYAVKSTSFVPAHKMPSGGLLAKVVNLAHLPYVDTRWCLSRSSVQRQVREEAALYCRALAPLQGSVVPRFYGLYEGHYGKAKAGIMILLLEAVGEPVAETCVDLNKADCAQVVGCYEALHAANVVHGDTGIMHMRRAADGTLRIIDFENSWVVNPRRKREKADIDDEYRCVLREFGYAIPERLRNLVPPWEMSGDEDDE